MLRNFSRIASFILLFGLLSGPAAQASTRVYVNIGPPAVVVQARPVRPHPGWVWRPGYHRWDDNRYHWVAGSWVRPPHRGAVWVPGRWHHARAGWYWTGGYWRR